MLVLQRKEGEAVTVGNDITFTILKIRSSRVQIGVSAPDDMKIMRTVAVVEVTESGIDPVTANEGAK